MYNNIMNMGNLMSSIMGGSGCSKTNSMNALAALLGGNGCNMLSGCGSSNGLEAAIMNYLMCNSGMGNMFGGLFGNYTAMGYDNDFMQYFGPYAQTAMIENDIETQKKQLETQLQVAQKELESVEKAEEQAIGRATPKYA